MPELIPLSEVKKADPDVLGGKGAGLARLRLLGVTVPDAFILPVMSKHFASSYAFATTVRYALLNLQLPHPAIPLVSVRSSAPVSMPGMMDTVLNLGLADAAVYAALRKYVGKANAVDMATQFIEWWRVNAFPFFPELFKAGHSPTEKNLKDALRGIQDSNETSQQIIEAVRVVAQSYRNDRAMVYRTVHGIAETGTAVVVQAMVFGNGPGISGTGVLFTRDPTTGANAPVGEFLDNAQGEALVSGLVTPGNLSSMREAHPDLYAEVIEVGRKIERDVGYPQDVEFTIDNGKLWILQTRDLKRSAVAALRIATEIAKETPSRAMRAMRTVTLDDFGRAQAPQLKVEANPDYVGLPASPGVVTGFVASTLGGICALKGAGKRAIFVSDDTSPDDVGAMAAADGIVTMRGGLTCHAAVVARSLNRPAVVGLGEDIHQFIEAAEEITLCGATGWVWCSAQPVTPAASTGVVDDFVKELYLSTGAYPIADTVTGGRQVLDISGWFEDRQGFHARLVAALEGMDRPLLRVEPSAAQEALYELFGPTQTERMRMLEGAVQKLPTDRQHSITYIGDENLVTPAMGRVTSIAALVLSKGAVVVDVQPKDETEVRAVRKLLSEGNPHSVVLSAALAGHGVQAYATADDMALTWLSG